MQDKFGGPLQARRGSLLDVLALPGFVAERDGRPIGLVTYRLDNDECELAVIAALERHRGVGTALLEALLQAVAGCERIWLVTTNDNLDAYLARANDFPADGYIYSPYSLEMFDQLIAAAKK